MRFLCTNRSYSSSNLRLNLPQTLEHFAAWFSSAPSEWQAARRGGSLLGWGGRSAGLVGGEWCPCWAARLNSVEAGGPAKDSLMRDTWKTVWPARLIQHAQYDDTLRSIAPHGTHCKIYQVIRWEQTHTRFCHVMEPKGLNVPAFQQHVNNNASYGYRNIKPHHWEIVLLHAAIVFG